MDKFKELVKRCSCGVSLEVNQHRNMYDTVEQFLETYCSPLEIEPEVLVAMIETDTVVRICFYPHTPIGFTDIFHYDIDAALEKALEHVEKEDLSQCPDTK